MPVMEEQLHLLAIVNDTLIFTDYVLENSLEYIYNSEFLGNRARIGPVIRALGAMNFVLENDITKNNVATFGGDIAANPDYMRLVIYEVDRSFIYLANVTYDYMIAYHSTVEK